MPPPGWHDLDPVCRQSHLRLRMDKEDMMVIKVGDTYQMFAEGSGGYCSSVDFCGTGYIGQNRVVSISVRSMVNPSARPLWYTIGNPGG